VNLYVVLCEAIQFVNRWLDLQNCRSSPLCHANTNICISYFYKIHSLYEYFVICFSSYYSKFYLHSILCLSQTKLHRHCCNTL